MGVKRHSRTPGSYPPPRQSFNPTTGSRRVVQPSLQESFPASRSSPPGAKAFPKVTHPSCRLPLVALHRYLEASNRGDRMRIAVQSSARERLLLRLFQGRAGLPDGAWMLRSAGERTMPPSDGRFLGDDPHQTEKKTLSRGLTRRHRTHKQRHRSDFPAPSGPEYSTGFSYPIWDLTDKPEDLNRQ